MGATDIKAQGWCQDRKAIWSIGLGGTQGIAVGRGYSALGILGLSVNHSGEFRVHDYVGVGYQVALNAYFNRFGGGAVLSIPVMAKVNVHILEIFSDRVSVADQLDVYAGIHVGGGPAFGTASGSGVFGAIHVGPQAGIRYWFNPKIAIFGEFGWGATFTNIGVTF